FRAPLRRLGNRLVFSRRGAPCGPPGSKDCPRASLPPLRPCPRRGDEGGADRRGCRRSVCRLRYLSRGTRPALLRPPTAFPHPAAPVPQALPLSAGVEAAITPVPGGLLRRWHRPARRLAFLTPAALPQHHRRKDLLFG